MSKENIPNLLLRISIAFSFFYVAFAAYRDPASWIAYSPLFVRNLLPENILLIGLLILHTVLGIWILTKWKLSWSSALAGLYLLVVVIVNFSQMDVLFRDISLALAAFALAVMSAESSKSIPDS